MLIHDVVVQECEKGAVGLFAQDNGSYLLKVPFGMGGMTPAEALAVLYKSFSIFRRTRHSHTLLAKLDGLESRLTQGLDDSEGGTSFCDALGLDELFERADPLHLLSLCERRAQQPWNVSRQLERHLHLALYDNSGAPYLERAPGSRRETLRGSSDIVGLYCLIAEDFYLRFLDVNPVRVWGNFSADVQAMAANFRHRYLAANDSLYGEDPQQCLRTRQHLQYLLREINRSTSLRNSDYRRLHETLDRYLHGGRTTEQHQGQVWGVNNFWAVWESVCLHHAAGASGQESFLTCEFEHMPAVLSSPELTNRWLKYRAALYHHNGLERRPDLVLNTQSQVKVIDFKYYRTPPAQRYTQNLDPDLVRLEKDFRNLEIYGLLTHNYLLRETGQGPQQITLEFWLPGREAQHTPIVHEPAWMHPIAVVRLCTPQVMRDYSQLYNVRGL
ncbi:hypothetical protein BFW86_18630 [Pseudomonas fluorescens]|nr:hypothetical protein BFW86_18630 [Pseudomonas fluorescens]